MTEETATGWIENTINSSQINDGDRARDYPRVVQIELESCAWVCAQAVVVSIILEIFKIDK